MKESPRLITAEQAKDSIRRLVALRGENYVYEAPDLESCVYAHDGQPSCGIGVIMHKDYGVPISELEKWDRSNMGNSAAIALALEATLFIDCDEEAVEIFKSFQRKQDFSKPYKECAEAAGVHL